MISRIKLWFAGLGVVLAGLAAVWAAGRRSAKNQEVRRRVAVAEKAQEVQDEVNDMGADARRDDIARWMRD